MRVTQAILSCLLLGVATAAASQQIFTVELKANSIAFSPQNGKLYATVPSSVGMPYGNRLVEISVDGAGITNSVYVGSEPTPIAVSPDLPVAYVGLMGAAQVRRIDLATMTAGLSFPLGKYFNNVLYPQDIASMPGSPETIAVSRRDSSLSARHEGVAIFDSGVMRAVTTPRSIGSNFLAFPSDSQLLFGQATGSSLSGTYKMVVDASGVTIIDATNNLVQGDFKRLVGSGTTVYATTGHAFDIYTFASIGRYAASGPVLVDDALGIVSFAVAATGGEAILRSFDRDSFALLDADVTLPSGGGAALHAVRCGLACAAVLQENARIVIVRDHVQ